MQEQIPILALVARSTRAWIETQYFVSSGGHTMSHALRVRGLKHQPGLGRTAPADVARSTRAWIETTVAAA